MSVSETEFTSAYMRITKILRGISKAYGIPPCDAEDLVQEAYCAYFANYTLEDEKEFKRILMKIMKNKCVDYYREKKNYISLEDVNEMRVYNIYDNPESRIIEKEESKEIRAKVSRLKREYKDIILLHNIQEKNTEEICDILQISETACYSRIYRAKRCIGQIIEAKYKVIVSFFMW